MTIDELQIEITSNGENATKGLDALVASLDRLSSIVRNATSGMAEISNGLHNIVDAVKSIDFSSITSAFDGMNSKIGEASEKFINLTESANGVDMSGIKQKSNNAADALDQVGKKAIETSGKISSAFSQIGSFIKSIFSSIWSTVKPVIGGIGSAIAALPSKISQAFGNLKSSIQSFATSAGNVLKSISQIPSQMAAGFSKIRSAVSSAIHPIHSLRSALGLADKQAQSFNSKLLSAMKRILMYRVIRYIFSQISTGFKEGIKNIAQFDSQVKSSMSSITSDLTYLKNSLGALAAPILNVLAPAFEYLVNIIVQAVNAIGMFIAALTGKGTFTKATRSVQEYGDAVSGASKEQKGLATGFDEVNVITQQSTAGGGGGAAGVEGMFETVAISDNILNLIDILKGPLDELYDYFFEAGYNLGNKLLDGLEKIPWDKIQDWGVRIATAAAASINGFFTAIDERAGIIGDSIGNLVNLLFKTIYTFFTETDWGLIGQVTAQELNAAIEKINWKQIGQTFASKWNAAINYLYRFVKNFNWKKFGKSIAEAVNGWFDEIEWDKAGETISTGIKGALNTISTAIKEINWKKIGADIQKFLTSIDWAEIWKAVKEVISSAASGIADFLTGLLFGENAETPDRLSGTIQSFIELGAALAIVIPLASSVLKFFKDLKTEAVGIALLIGGITLAFSGAESIGAGSTELMDYIKTAVGAALGIAGSLLVFGTGPLGWSIGIAAGLIATISGFVIGNKEALTSMVEEAFYGYSEGSYTITMLAENFSLAMDEIIAINQPIIDAGVSIKEAGDAAKTASDNIALISTAINLGAYDVETKIPEIQTQFELLRDNTKSVLDETYDNIIYAISTSMYDALTDLGVYVPSVVELLASVKRDIDATFSDLTTSYNEVSKAFEEGKISPEEYATEIIALAGQMEELTAKTNPVKDAFQDVTTTLNGIDWEDPTAVDNAFEVIKTSAENARTSIDESYETIKGNVESMRGWSDDPSYQLALDQIFLGNEASRAEQLSSIDTQLQEIFGQMQESLIGGADAVATAANEKWETLNPLQKAFTSQNTYVSLALGEYANNVITPVQNGMIEASGGVETEVSSSLGGMVENIWSTILSSKFDWTSVLSAFKKDGSDNIGGAINDAISDATTEIENPSKELGTAINTGSATGVTDSIGLVTDAINETSIAADNAFKSYNQIASPSGLYESHGSNMMAGLDNGVRNNSGIVISSMIVMLQTLTKDMENFIKTNNLSFENFLQKIIFIITTYNPKIVNAFSSILNNLTVKIDAFINKTITDFLNMMSQVQSMVNQLSSMSASASASASSVSAAASTLSAASNSGNVAQYASGGFPKKGKLFLSDEDGAELVGTIGGRTSVANQDEIGDAIFRYMDAYGGTAGGLTKEDMAEAVETAAARLVESMTLQIDGVDFANAVFKTTKNAQQRAGQVLFNF